MALFAYILVHKASLRFFLKKINAFIRCFDNSEIKSGIKTKKNYNKKHTCPSFGNKPDSKQFFKNKKELENIWN